MGGIRIAGIGIGLALLLPTPASALQLRYKFKPGSTTTYRVMVASAALAQIPVAPEPVKMQFSLELKTVQKVLSLSRSGVADLEWTNSAGTMKMTAMGRSNSSKLPREVTRLKLTDRGKLLSYRAQPASGGQAPVAAPAGGPIGMEGADPMRALAGLNFPDRDLKPGDTWAAESKVDMGNGQSVVMKIASKFEALTSYKGRKCARITTAFEMPMDATGMGGEGEGASMKGEGKVAGQVTTLFDYEAGRELYADGSVVMLVKLQMSGAMDPAAGQSLEMTSAMKLNVRQVLID
jgi:hypothetical protein